MNKQTCLYFRNIGNSPKGLLCSGELWDGAHEMFSTCDSVLYVDIPYEFVCNICNLRHQSVNYCILNYFTTPFVYKTLGRWKKLLKLHFNCITSLALSALLFLVLTGFQPWSFSSFRTECWKILGLTGWFRVPECLDCGTFSLYSLSQNIEVLEGKWFLTFKKNNAFFFFLSFVHSFLLNEVISLASGMLIKGYLRNSVGYNGIGESWKGGHNWWWFYYQSIFFFIGLITGKKVTKL